MGVPENMDGGSLDDSGKWVIAGIALSSPLQPIFTTNKRLMEKSDAEEEEEEEEEECSTTPTCAESRIPSRLPCPPPPKKLKPAPSRCRYEVVLREFFNPPNLETIFHN